MAYLVRPRPECVEPVRGSLIMILRVSHECAPTIKAKVNSGCPSRGECFQGSSWAPTVLHRAGDWIVEFGVLR
ncbi:hypothetical protein QJS10_CPB14g00944 [Acorus calamus]|uniref:Uncharacterized protein n=1 Tax=Acorus calamus TaxID=4465 RepID=A0AAV9DEJ1_ACOCL|nr:hypothetical protein QJS10_CPB14g00944 [Acorus calamus]